MSWFSKQYKQLDERGRVYLHGVEQSILPKAKDLHTNAKWIYGLYGALDGLSCSLSMLRFIFDARYANSTLSSADMLHDWLLTEEGFSFLVFETSAMIGFATIGNLYIAKNLDPDATLPEEIKNLAENWDWFRNGMKALKNGYRGVRNAIVFTEMFALVRNLRYLVMPVGIVLGGISMINRPLLNIMRDGRAATIKEVKQLIKEVPSEPCEWAAFEGENKNRINSLRGQLEKYRSFWLLASISATYNGVLDAPNLYFGAVTLTVLAPAPWIFITVAAFALACVAARVYEEYEEQVHLLKAQTNLKLTLAQLANNQEEYARYKKDFDEQSKLSFWSYFFGSITNSMDAYSALASIMFSTATICTLMSITFPPLLLSACTAAGAACLVVPLVHVSVRYFFDHDMKQVFFKKWFEVCRSFFAGGNKGLRSMDSILPSWQDLGKDGHYHNTDSMIPLAWLLAIPYALGFSLRAVAKVGEKSVSKELGATQAVKNAAMNKQEKRPESSSSIAENLTHHGLFTVKANPNQDNSLISEIRHCEMTPTV